VVPGLSDQAVAIAKTASVIAATMMASARARRINNETGADGR
jgi:hypothetical protein